jgi:uncharacterized membrane protein
MRMRTIVAALTLVATSPLAHAQQQTAHTGARQNNRAEHDGGSTMRITSVGHAVFAATMVALGILGLIGGDFTVIWQPVPRGVPTRQALVYLCAFVSVGGGLGLLWTRTAAWASRILLGYVLLWLLVFRLPELLHSIAVDVYWSVCKTAVMVAAAWVAYVWFATDWDKRYLSFATGANGLRIARALYGLAMIPFGIAHFQYLEHTASLVPGWLPAHMALACLTGGAFVAAGVAVLVGVCARLAVALSALQMGLFLLLVWVPVVTRGSISAFNWGETVVSWALTAASWLVADSYALFATKEARETIHETQLTTMSICSRS